MTGFGGAMTVIIIWATWSPATFGQHLAKIADAFETARAKLHAERETTP